MEKRSEILSYFILVAVFLMLFFFLGGLSQKITGYGVVNPIGIEGTCSGTPTACNTYTTSTTCSDQSGCSWGIENICGDGVLYSGVEACDDSNLEDYDGCAANCTIEYNFACLGEPSICSWGVVTDDSCTVSNNECINNTGNYSNYCTNETHLLEYGCNNVNSCAPYSLKVCGANTICEGNQCISTISLNETETNQTNQTNNIISSNTNSEATYNNQEPATSEPYVSTSGECKSNECELRGKCYSVGYRTKEKRYCGVDNSWASQKETASCLNSFECGSHLCEERTCVQRGFGARASARLGCIFGSGSCKGTGGYFVRLFGNQDAM